MARPLRGLVSRFSGKFSFDFTQDGEPVEPQAVLNSVRPKAGFSGFLLIRFIVFGSVVIKTMFIIILETIFLIIVSTLIFWFWLHWVSATIIMGILIPVIMWILFFWGKRGVLYAMKITYEKIRGYYVANNLPFSEKELLLKTLQSRYTYKNRPVEELEKIVEENPDIYFLVKFVIKDEGG